MVMLPGSKIIYTYYRQRLPVIYFCFERIKTIFIQKHFNSAPMEADYDNGEEAAATSSRQPSL